ncbi:DUF1674 domain-containing protein [Aestuariispira insulae]|uniref:DUF1674 domain-containing protein n=1 Tax=Aestuariispira insulae TaxID=1461337 RepID=A0A3D9HF74_9PROT|nr:succinate dehydrogenase assembly factor 4 [Aestuariispira insulae]RED48123.1 hypothetical protein DFP90_108142 [Aestuariispira insulae]
MNKLAELLKFARSTDGKAPEAEPAQDQPTPEAKGHDSRSLAEEKADLAGEKWRKMAEANGEIDIEIGGPKGLEPTRYGDWERAGRCVDF